MKLKFGFFHALLLLLLVIGLLYIYHYTMNSPYRVSAEVAKILIKNNKLDIILDVRTQTEVKTFGAYSSSVNIQSADLEKIMPKMYPNKMNLILVYCNTGQRARNATEKLHELGYKNAMYIASDYTSLQ